MSRWINLDTLALSDSSPAAETASRSNWEKGKGEGRGRKEERKGNGKGKG